MKVLVLGSGAKEHAIVWKLSQSRRISGLFVATGNAGMNPNARVLNLSICDVDAIYAAYVQYGIDVIFLGTEHPECENLVDRLIEKGACVIGTPKKALVLNDKRFMIDFATKNHIPVAETYLFDSFEELGAKADELIAGGSCVLKAAREISSSMLRTVRTREELLDHARLIFDLQNEVAVQRNLDGVPVTLTAFVDNEGYLLFPACSEYSRVSTKPEADITGGMGAIAPSPYVTQSVMKRIQDEIVHPTIKGLIADGRSYRGILVFSLILEGTTEPKLVNYHHRLNDPATQAMMPLLNTDLVDVLSAMLEDNVKSYKLELSDDMAVAVVVASAGYPDQPKLGERVHLSYNYPDQNSVLFFGAVDKAGASYVTTGGRPFTASGWASTIEQANNNAYNRIRSVAFDGAWSRPDIGTEFFEDSDE